jgi:hypothetical protein
MSQDFNVPVAPDAQPAKQTNVWLIVGIVAAVIVILTCCCIVAFFALPTVFGPIIDNIFTNTIEGLQP